ncbi:hypothetical protein GPJ56_009820 [Histomonas meleagridis]|uniref:uncharacterized protein n=1 Tax=Histomonas meleagridis TaxID=135588 RepID=UPI0035594838|nr:hypothetical protein GPJ56_009820 [Histomonas meleagridis]KAH0802873.1 hypothetical protein GO595_004380 [Histomonas meleagridis]
MEEKPNDFLSSISNLQGMKGIPVRKRVDPLISNELKLYQCTYNTVHTIRGTRIKIQFSREGKILYSTKLKGRRPEKPIPIAKGPEMHYSSKEFAGFLLTGNNHNSFSLRAKTEYGKEILSIQISHPSRNRNIPKDISLTFFQKDSLVPQKLVNRKCDYNADGYWEIDFDGKEATPSTKNCILVNECNNCEYIGIRKISNSLIEIDSVEIVTPLSVFGIALSVFIAQT